MCILIAASCRHRNYWQYLHTYYQPTQASDGEKFRENLRNISIDTTKFKKNCRYCPCFTNKEKYGLTENPHRTVLFVVGVTGLEPAASWSRRKFRSDYIWFPDVTVGYIIPEKHTVKPTVSRLFTRCFR